MASPGCITPCCVSSFGRSSLPPVVTVRSCSACEGDRRVSERLHADALGERGGRGGIVVARKAQQCGARAPLGLLHSRRAARRRRPQWSLAEAAGTQPDHDKTLKGLASGSDRGSRGWNLYKGWGALGSSCECGARRMCCELGVAPSGWPVCRPFPVRCRRSVSDTAASRLRLSRYRAGWRGRQPGLQVVHVATT